MITLEIDFKNQGDGDFARIPVEGNLKARTPVCWTGKTASGIPSVHLADSEKPNRRPAIGVLMHDVKDGGFGHVLFFGLIELGTQLSTGSAYLGPEGTIVSEPPEYAQSLGSVGAGWLLVNPDSGE